MKVTRCVVRSLVFRFNRCLDLYLCPRSLKMAMNVDPESLLPQLPSPNELRPFPTHRRVDYLPLSLYCQFQPQALPLLTLSEARRRAREEQGSVHAASSKSGDAAELSACCVDYTGQWVAVGGADQTLRVVELLTGKQFLSFRLQQPVTALAFHPRLPLLAAAIEDQLLLLVLDLPLFDQTTASQLTQASERGEAKAGEAKKHRACGSEGADAESEHPAQDESEGDMRRANLAKAKALLKRVHEVVESDEEGTEEESSKAEKEEDEALGEKRRQQTLKGVGVWKQIDVKGAAAPVEAGGLQSEKKKKGLPLLQLKRGEETKKQTLPEEEETVSAPLGGILCGISILHDSTIRSLTWHHKGTYLIAMCPGSASPSQQCSVHSLEKQKTIHPIRRAAGGHMKAAVFHATKPWLIVAYHKGIRIFDLHSNKKVGPKGGKHQALVRKLVGAEAISSIDVHPSGEQIIAGAENRRLYIFDLELSSRVYKIMRSHKGAITCACLHPSFPLMCTASADGTVQIYHFKVFNDLITNPLIVPVRTLRVVEEPQKNGGVLCCMWHPTQPWLVTADRSGQCSLWT
ncbi:putative ribosome biogenesis protein BOP1 [Toxoplasma gondii ARI]|uniref:Putative ribosome biogenesis protein BOP1 n=1 Tax=Toxoplasma gondii ARI TaxID=1074872 RepID=A0A139XJL0_TOXGO|nr:putative ribosome biogenesis protein BOP1 [Toxoplasma gondii ARI]